MERIYWCSASNNLMVSSGPALPLYRTRDTGMSHVFALVDDRHESPYRAYVGEASECTQCGCTVYECMRVMEAYLIQRIVDRMSVRHVTAPAPASVAAGLRSLDMRGFPPSMPPTSMPIPCELNCFIDEPPRRYKSAHFRMRRVPETRAFTTEPLPPLMALPRILAHSACYAAVPPPPPQAPTATHRRRLSTRNLFPDT